MKDFDAVLKEVGDFGRYQISVFLLICLPASLPSAFSAFNQPFVVGQPPKRCKFSNHRNELAIGGDLTFSVDDLNCWQYNQTEIDLLLNYSDVKIGFRMQNLSLIPCQNGWEYDNSTYIDTLVTEYNLVCDQKYWADLTSVMFYIGSFIGNILFGHIADKFGRRAAFFIILTTMVTFGTLNAFSWNVQSFAVLRFLIGLPFPALFQIPFIISMEFMGESGRIFSGIMIDIFFGIAMALLGVLAMLTRRWRHLIFYSNAPFALFFLYYFILPESPRWLISVGRFSEAKTVLKRIAEVNGHKAVDIDELMSELKQSERSGPPKRTSNIYDLFKTPNLRMKTILVTYIWFVNALVYNGLTYNISNLPVDDYLSFIINGIVEIPAYLLVWPLLDTAGRRWSMILSMSFAGIACLSTAAVPTTSEYTWLIAGLAYMGKFGIAASFAVIYIFASELYPTVLRAIGMGMSSMVAGFGLILGPHLVRLGDWISILPLLIMGTLSVTAAFATLFLPETLGSSIPQTVENAEEFKSDRKVRYFQAKSGNVKRLDNVKEDEVTYLTTKNED